MSDPLRLIEVHDSIAPSGADSNLLAALMNDVFTYRDFVSMRAQDVLDAASRYLVARQRSTTAVDEELAEIPSGASTVLSAQTRALQRITWRHHQRCRLEVEGLLIVTTMALDRCARMTEEWCGAGSKPWHTARSFRYLESYMARRGLPAPSAGLLSARDWLLENVVEYRHHYLAHKIEGPDRPRHDASISLHMETGVLYYGIGGVLYPKSGEEPYSNTSTSQVSDMFSQFLGEWAQLLASC